jgi:hypothetical protein
VITGVRHTEGNDYLGQMCDLLGSDEVDGFAIHGYAAPWHDAVTSRGEYQAGYLSQLAVLDNAGFAAQPVFITEWNRRVEPIDDYNEAQSAQFLHGALLDLHTWNQRHVREISAACWFIYQYDSGGWANYSIEYLHGVGPGGADNDLWDAFQYACTLNLPTAYPSPTSPEMNDDVPVGANVAPASTSVSTDSGDGWLAIDGVISAGSKWTSAGTPAPHWLQLDLGGGRLVTGFVVRHAGAGGEPSYYNTRTFLLETATDAAGPWDVPAMVFNQDSADSSARTYILEARAIRHVRLTITDPGIDDYARIPEFEVYAASPFGDFDEDGDVDWDDALMFMFCMQGPDDAYVPGHACTRGDADDDWDLDLADFAAFQQAFEQ